MMSKTELTGPKNTMNRPISPGFQRCGFFLDARDLVIKTERRPVASKGHGEGQTDVAHADHGKANVVLVH
jgi:hypothetical protein